MRCLLSKDTFVHKRDPIRVCVTSPRQDIYMDNLSVKWDNVIGLEEAKKLVKEAVVYPIKVCLLPAPAAISASILNASPLTRTSRRCVRAGSLTGNRCEA